jgi:putative oxidoreductase
MQLDLAKLILRISIGGMMLFHGIAKIEHGIGFIQKMVVSKNLPEFIAYGVYIGEILVPIFLILGLFTRVSGLILAFNMLVAILLVHSHELLALGEHGEWLIELPMLYLVGGVLIGMLGAGRYSIDHQKR